MSLQAIKPNFFLCVQTSGRITNWECLWKVFRRFLLLLLKQHTTFLWGDLRIAPLGWQPWIWRALALTVCLPLCLNLGWVLHILHSETQSPAIETRKCVASSCWHILLWNKNLYHMITPTLNRIVIWLFFSCPVWIPTPYFPFLIIILTVLRNETIGEWCIEKFPAFTLSTLLAQRGRKWVKLLE